MGINAVNVETPRRYENGVQEDQYLHTFFFRGLFHDITTSILWRRSFGAGDVLVVLWPKSNRGLSFRDQSRDRFSLACK